MLFSSLVREWTRLRRHWQRGRVPLALLLAVLGQFAFFAAADAATITVDRADDTAAASACTATANDCSLRGAFAFANANPGTTITLPAGTYNLTLGELRIGTATNTNTTIAGAGAATTIIHQTTANSRVINVNPNYVANVTASIAGVTITGGSNPGDLYHGAGIIGGGPGNTLNLRNCTITGNTDTSGSVPKGGGVEFAGGGFLNIDRCTIANNTAGSAASNLGVGGGVDFSLLNNPGAAGQGGLSITNSTFTGNKAGAQNGAGGALSLAVTTTQTPRTVTITNNTFTGNQANAAAGGYGGAIDNTSSNPITVKFNRFANNTATGGATGIYQGNGTIGTIDATANWWGCNAGPGNTGCDTIGGRTAAITVAPRLFLTVTASANPLQVNQASALTASFLKDSAGNALTLANLSAVIGLPITFSATGGTISGAQTTIQPTGTATATFTASAAGGDGTATVDNGTASAAITVNRADTATTITADTPDPSLVGQPYTVRYSVVSGTGSTPTAPTGGVTVSDGTDSCTGTIAAGQCTLTPSTVGSKTLTATYQGDSNFNGSGGTAAHTVNGAPTITSANATTFTERQPGSFLMTTNGFPTPSLSASGALPGGVTFRDNGDGTATMSGTPAEGSRGNFPLTITAANGVSPDATQTFTITVTPAPSPSPSPSPSASPSPSGGPAPSGSPAPSASPSPSGSPAPAPVFADVSADYWAAPQIAQFAQRRITTGCGDDEQGRRLYCPERGVTRAEMAAFLTRALGQDQQAPPSTPTFADVPADYWAYGQIEAFVRLGITTGCGVDDLGRRLYCPERGVTRAEMAAFLDRAKGQAELFPAVATFADVPPAYWAYGWIERFLALNITTGCGTDDNGNRVYCPDRGVTRAEMAVFIIRAYP